MPSASGVTPDAGAGLKIVVAPDALARRRASIALAVGISCPTRTTSPRAGRSRSRTSADVLGQQRCIGTAGHGDAVLAARVDQDERDAGGLILERSELGHVDAIGLERGSRLRPECVGTDRADERRSRTEPRGRHGLVAALAAVMLGEPAAGHGLPRRRQSIDGRDEVDVDRPDDDDANLRPMARGGVASAFGARVPVPEGELTIR